MRHRDCLAAFALIGLVSAMLGQPALVSAQGSKPTARLTRVAEDPSYGYKSDKPVGVGGGVIGGPANQRKYLNALLGPSGQRITYSRLGSCCAFERKSQQPIDVYAVTYEGLAEPIELFLDSYTTGPLLIPIGLSSLNDKSRSKKGRQ
jgi:hypothetical protein